MKKFFRMCLGIAVLGLVSACGHVRIGDGLIYEDSDPQAYAGLNLTELIFCKNKLGGFEVCKAINVDGKEQADISLTWSVNQDGMFQVEYTARDTRAFEAFRTIADVRARFGSIVADTLLRLAVPASIGASAIGGAVVVPDGDDGGGG